MPKITASGGQAEIVAATNTQSNVAEFSGSPQDQVPILPDGINAASVALPSERPQVAYVCNWNLCEIGFELWKGFVEYTDWGFWSMSTGGSWIGERTCLRLNPKAPLERDFELGRAIVQQADVVHINNSHNHVPCRDVDMAGKRLAMMHHGMEYRYRWRQFEWLETTAGYLRIVSTPDLLMYASDNEKRRTLHWLPEPIDLRELDRCYPKWGRAEGAPVQVLHGYTVKGNKGTDEIARIVTHTKGCDLNLIHHVQRRRSVWHVAQCDIYFATFLYGPGMASIEAMALGKPVIAGCTEHELQYQMQAIGVTRPENLPWLYATPETAPQVLRDLASDPDMRQHWGRKGREYVEQWHSLPNVVNRLKTLYEQAEPARGLIIKDMLKAL